MTPCTYYPYLTIAAAALAVLFLIIWFRKSRQVEDLKDKLMEDKITMTFMQGKLNQFQTEKEIKKDKPI